MKTQTLEELTKACGIFCVVGVIFAVLVKFAPGWELHTAADNANFVKDLIDIQKNSTKEKAFAAIKQLLKDPSSAKFENVVVNNSVPNVWHVCGFVNAKNTLGGYVGPKRFYFTGSSGTPGAVLLEGDDDAALAIMWSACT